LWLSRQLGRKGKIALPDFLVGVSPFPLHFLNDYGVLSSPEKECSSMNRVNKGLVLAVVASLGMWGCAKGPANGTSTAERIKQLEYKNGKLEEDVRAAAAARDALRQKVTGIEEQLQKEVDQLRSVVKVRDDLRTQLATRTGERDALQVQYDQFRKGLRDLLGQAEAALNTPGSAPATAAAVAAGGKS
jgi:septal ring factor EnvC (AmiA/AmiB activator)